MSKRSTIIYEDTIVYAARNPGKVAAIHVPPARAELARKHLRRMLPVDLVDRWRSVNEVVLRNGSTIVIAYKQPEPDESK